MTLSDASPTISLAMIVRDEADMISAFLERARTFAAQRPTVALAEELSILGNTKRPVNY